MNTHSTFQTGTTLLLGALSVVLLSSCGSTQQARVALNHSLVEATPRGVHKNRIKGTRIVAANGNGIAEGDQALTLNPGLNKVTVQFDWPQGGSQQVGLRFRARSNQGYFVSYDPFPPTHDQWRGTSEAGNAAQIIGREAMNAGPAGAMLLLSPALALHALDVSQRTADQYRENRAAARYVDVLVISRDPAEGVVRRVRAYADGRLDWKRWDAWSSAPASGVSKRPEFADQDYSGFIRRND